MEAASYHDVPDPALCQSKECKKARAKLPPEAPKPKTFYAGLIDRWTSLERTQ